MNEYKSEAYALFEKLMVELRQNVTRWMMTVEFNFIPTETTPQPLPMFEFHLDAATGQNERDGAALATGGRLHGPPMSPNACLRQPLPAGWERTSRNAMCPCGSGKKFKHCHGALV